MEQDKLDDLFRNIIREDQSDLNDEERTSKEAVWNRLELPKKKSKFHFWKIAATVLFLLLSGTMTFVLNNRQTEEERFSQLEIELDQTKNALQALEAKLSKSEKALREEATPNIENPTVVTKSNVPLEKEIIEKVVVVHDTIWMEKNQKVNENVRFVKDTIFIEVPTKAPVQWVNEILEIEESEKVIDEKKIKKKKKYPSKVEFVFGKKPLPKPSRKLELYIDESEVAKKEKGGLITIPINN